MSDNIRLPEPFTPLFESVLHDLGRGAAMVYGRVWRYCQGPERACCASNRAIATSLGMGTGTVNRQLKRLVAQGYLRDTTPGRRRSPHRYQPTGKAGAHRKAAPASPKPGVPPRNRVFHAGTDSRATVPLQQSKRQELKRQGQETGTPQPARAESGIPPELRLFRLACGFLPAPALFGDVVAAIRQVGVRLGRAPTAADLQVYFKAWIARGYNPRNLAWLLSWAAHGQADAPQKGPPLGSNPARPDRASLPLGDAERERLIRFYNGLPDA